jgi:4-hydroxy-4-methyl-2-oxoglutarate aldolase
MAITMTRLLFTLIAIAAAAQAQLFHLTPQELIEYTAKNPFERFADGRPKVPDSILQRAQTLSAEEVWAVLPGFQVGPPPRQGKDRTRLHVLSS